MGKAEMGILEEFSNSYFLNAKQVALIEGKKIIAVNLIYAIYTHDYLNRPDTWNIYTWSASKTDQSGISLLY